jgi:hypothetical protein
MDVIHFTDVNTSTLNLDQMLTVVQQMDEEALYDQYWSTKEWKAYDSKRLELVNKIAELTGESCDLCGVVTETFLNMDSGENYCYPCTIAID